MNQKQKTQIQTSEAKFELQKMKSNPKWKKVERNSREIQRPLPSQKEEREREI